MDSLHPELRRFVRTSRLIAVFACVLAAYLLLGAVAPELVPGARVPRWVLVPLSALVLGAAWLAGVYGSRWYRRASWVVSRVGPSVMHLEIDIRRSRGRDDVTDSIYALLRPESEPGGGPPERIQVQFPSWDASTLPEGPAEVFRDPQPGGPVVIRTSRGLLCAVPGSVSKKRRG